MLQCEFCQNKVRDEATLDGFPATFIKKKKRTLSAASSPVIRKSAAIPAKWIKPHNQLSGFLVE